MFLNTRGHAPDLVECGLVIEKHENKAYSLHLATDIFRFIQGVFDLSFGSTHFVTGACVHWAIWACMTVCEHGL